MKKVGTSTLFVEKYRPKTIEDLVLPESIITFFKKIIINGDCPNLLFAGTAGKGKTSAAYCICNDLDADYLYINASLETSIDNLRYKVQGFASTHSLLGGCKVIILDEADRLSPQAMDSLKGLIEQVEANCRFIIEPIRSRTQLIDFNFPASETKALVLTYFKRLCFVLETEKIEYDKKTLAEFTQMYYPDFRKILNELQRCANTFGVIDANIFKNLDDTILRNLISELKGRKFSNVRKLAADIDPDSFYGNFYAEVDTYLKDESKPEIILILAKYAYESALSVNRELTLVACLIEIMKEAKWR